jgi:4-hydroxybenzoate polyprenyltransferase
MMPIKPVNHKSRDLPGAVAVFAESIKFQHSIFALPFAILGIMLGIQDADFPGITTLFLTICCCVTARTAAMTFNRWLDADIDAKNPRTASRAVPSGLLSPTFMLQVTALSSLGFIVCAWFINSLAGILAPFALIVLLGYSATKRFTSLCHLVLGLALAIAPSGGYIAVTGRLDYAPVLLSLGVILWTAGFDIIYACQDEAFDREAGLYSIPALLGYSNALVIAGILHALCLPAFVSAGLMGQLGNGYLLGCAAVLVILVAQHIIVRVRGVSGIPMAFFTVNGWTGVVLLLFTVMGHYLGGNHP